MGLSVEVKARIAELWAEGAPAWKIREAPSTISRDVQRNGGRVRYRACPADRAFVRRGKRPKPAKLASCERLRGVVEAKLEQR